VKRIARILSFVLAPSVAAAQAAPAEELPEQPPTYEGTLAPATAAGTTNHALEVHPGLEVFAQFAHRITRAPTGDTSAFNQFDVPRVHASLDGAWQNVHARILLEAVRSAGEGALIGVSGDSLVVRVREAFAAYRFFDLLEARAGVLPTMNVTELDGTWRMRPITASPLELSGLATAADLGAMLKSDLPQKYGWLGVAMYNGEGYTQRELNRGKTVEGAAEIHPLPQGQLLPFAVYASYTAGSTGTEVARANRFMGALLWQGARLRAGIDFVYAWGVGADGTQRSLIADAFVRVEPIDRLLLGLRTSYWVRDISAEPTDAVTSLSGAVGWRIADPLETFLALTRSAPTTRANASAPGSDYWEPRLVARVVF
jgi:hypothetical protein